MRLDECLLVVGMNRALTAHKKAGTDLDAAGAERNRSGHLSAVRNATGRNDRHIERVHHLRNERHRRHLADMTAGLRSLGNDRICARTHETLCKGNGRGHRNHLNASRLPFVHINARISGACRDDLHAGARDDISHRLRVRIHQHEIDTERLVRQALRLLYVLLETLRVHAAGADDPESSRIRARGCEFTRRNIGHAALNNRIACADQFL